MSFPRRSGLRVKALFLLKLHRQDHCISCSAFCHNDVDSGDNHLESYWVQDSTKLSQSSAVSLFTPSTIGMTNKNFPNTPKNSLLTTLTMLFTLRDGMDGLLMVLIYAITNSVNLSVNEKLATCG